MLAAGAVKDRLLVVVATGRTILGVELRALRRVGGVPAIRGLLGVVEDIQRLVLLLLLLIG